MMKSAVLLGVALLGCGQEDPASGAPWKEKFELAQGGECSLPKGPRATLFFLIRPDCPISNAYHPEIKRLAKEYEPRGIASVVVYAEAGMESWKAECHSFEFDAGCPAILDPQLVLARWLGATVTPEAALVSPAGELLYRGRIDDRYPELGKQRPGDVRHDLRDALEAALAGRPAPCPRTESVGCQIEFPSMPGKEEGPTFAKDVASILFARCAPCHRPGEVGPFPLLSYEDAKKRAGQISRVAENRIMPPWKAVAGYGEFLHERRLSENEIATLRRWAEGGAPLGNPQDLPRPPEPKAGWTLGPPDLVLEIPGAFKIPAEGEDVNMHFLIPLDLSKGRYLRGLEVRPGNPRVVHHAVGFLDQSGTARRLSAGRGGYARFGGPGFVPAGITPRYVPGQVPEFFEPGTAITLGKGWDYVLQIHYHPSGKEELDRTTVGFYFTDEMPRRAPTGILMGSEVIDIPAGEKAHWVSDAYRLPADLEVRDIWAHMHMLGREVEVHAELPDGRILPMLKISDWDYNWQETYRYRNPLQLPRGTVIRAKFRYDNSEGNPKNPNHPPKRVTLGEKTTDEMAGIWIGGFAVQEGQERVFSIANLSHYRQMQGHR
ncbi:MAG TPA: alkyl hydroperoxide reductase [Planctomycetota bacterium]|nr:alkyl hydroperoxide reductase [Planctomycetota bacterium]